MNGGMIGMSNKKLMETEYFKCPECHRKNRVWCVEYHVCECGKEIIEDHVWCPDCNYQFY